MANARIGVAFVFGAIVASWWIAFYAGWACSSGEEIPGSLEDDLCESVARGTWRWLAIVWPAIVFGLSQLVPRLRAYAVPIALVSADPGTRRSLRTRLRGALSY